MYPRSAAFSLMYRSTCIVSALLVLSKLNAPTDLVCVASQDANVSLDSCTAATFVHGAYTVRRAFAQLHFFVTLLLARATQGLL